MIFMPLPRLCSGSKIESRAKEALDAVETGSAAPLTSLISPTSRPQLAQTLPRAFDSGTDGIVYSTSFFFLLPIDGTSERTPPPPKKKTKKKNNLSLE